MYLGCAAVVFVVGSVAIVMPAAIGTEAASVLRHALGVGDHMLKPANRLRRTVVSALTILQYHVDFLRLVPIVVRYKP